MRESEVCDLRKKIWDDERICEYKSQERERARE